MTTATITPQTPTEEIITEYEPTLADKINKVLYRLEHTGILGFGSLKQGKDFCILGMFADESGLGSWDKNGYFITHDGTMCSPSVLSPEVAEYYGFRSNNGEYYTSDLSPEDLAELKRLLNAEKIKYITLSSVNDQLVSQGRTKEAKQALTLLIKSGAPFRRSYP